jgi:hypothetical protein
MNIKDVLIKLEKLDNIATCRQTGWKATSLDTIWQRSKLQHDVRYKRQSYDFIYK